MATQTLFEKWCDEKGFDSKGVFTVASTYPLGFILGDKVKLKRDDKSKAPLFISKDGGEAHFLSFEKRLTQLPMDNTMKDTTTPPFPQTPFKLSCGDRPEVREWLKDNGCKWKNGDDLTLLSPTEKFLYVSDQHAVSYDNRKDRYTDKKLPELTLSFSDPIPAAVCALEFVKEEEEATTQAHSPSRKRKKLKKAIKKLQKELTKLEQEEA